MPCASSHPFIRPAAGMASLSRKAIAAFRLKVCVAPSVSVRRKTIPSDMPCTARPVASGALDISAFVAAPGEVAVRLSCQRLNCAVVKVPGIGRTFLLRPMSDSRVFLSKDAA